MSISKIQADALTESFLDDIGNTEDAVFRWYTGRMIDIKS